jgi:hypothetical protein
MSVQAERWRGECIQHFAELECLIENILQALATVPRRGRKVRVGEEVSCAFSHLRELTADKGAFAREGAKVACSLRLLSSQFEWRAHLTHGIKQVWRGKGAKWLLTFEHRSPGGGPVRLHALTWTDALAMLEALRKETESLRSRCGSLRAAVLKA